MRSGKQNPAISVNRLVKSSIAACVFLSALGAAGCGDGPENAALTTVADPPSEVRATLPPPTPTPEPTATPLPPTKTAAEAYPAMGPRTDWELVNTQGWLNGDSTTIADLRRNGEVVVVDFWTYT